MLILAATKMQFGKLFVVNFQENIIKSAITLESLILETFGENIWNQHGHFSLKTYFFAYKLNFDFLLGKPVKNDQIFFFRISTPKFELLLSLEDWVIGPSFIWIGRSVSELFDLKVSILTWGTLFDKNQEKVDFKFKTPNLQD